MGLKHAAAPVWGSPRCQYPRASASGKGRRRRPGSYFPKASSNSRTVETGSRPRKSARESAPHRAGVPCFPGLSAGSGSLLTQA